MWPQPRPGAPLLMGVVNVTPDSFSDGGRSGAAALAHAMGLLEAGADVLVAGSAIFSGSDYAARITALRTAGQQAPVHR